MCPKQLLAMMLITAAAVISPLFGQNKEADSQPASPLVHDLNQPDYNPLDCPAWAKEKLPDWVMPYVGKNGVPDTWAKLRNKPGPLSTPTKGLDRYQGNWFINYRPETAKYLYEEYTPLHVDYKKGTLPTYEAVAAKFTPGLTTDTDKAIALLTKAVPASVKHPVMPPCGPPTKPDRNLDDEALIKSGCAWCNEQARVFIRLCQVSGIPARMVHLFGQNHTVAEFYADGRWVMADASNFFVAAGTDGKLLSAAQCHDQGAGQRAYAEAKKRRMLELPAMSDGELGFGDPQKAEAFRKQARSFDAIALASRKDLAFGIINYPLPR